MPSKIPRAISRELELPSARNFAFDFLCEFQTELVHSVARICSAFMSPVRIEVCGALIGLVVAKLLVRPSALCHRFFIAVQTPGCCLARFAPQGTRSGLRSCDLRKA
jgi:hypothetical protein